MFFSFKTPMIYFKPAGGFWGGSSLLPIFFAAAPALSFSPLPVPVFCDADCQDHLSLLRSLLFPPYRKSFAVEPFLRKIIPGLVLGALLFPPPRSFFFDRK